MRGRGDASERTREHEHASRQVGARAQAGRRESQYALAWQVAGQSSNVRTLVQLLQKISLCYLKNCNNTYNSFLEKS